MQRNRRASIIVVGGALAVASIGYGLGTQADDGTAVAGSGAERNGVAGLRFERGTPPGFTNLAKTLGVNAPELRDALGDFREQEHGARRQELAAALAKALEVPVAKVGAALEQVQPEDAGDRPHRDGDRPDRHGGGPGPGGPARHALPLRQLANALDVTRAELRAAFEEIHPERPTPENGRKEHKAELAKFLADRFDLDVDKVTAALADLPRPPFHPHGRR